MQWYNFLALVTGGTSAKLVGHPCGVNRLETQYGQCPEKRAWRSNCSLPGFKRGAYRLRFTAGEDMPVGKSRRGVDKLGFPKWPSWIDQVGSTDLPVPRPAQLSPDQTAFIGEEKEPIALRSDIDTGPVFRRGHAVGGPEL